MKDSSNNLPIINSVKNNIVKKPEKHEKSLLNSLLNIHYSNKTPGVYLKSRELLLNNGSNRYFFPNNIKKSPIIDSKPNMKKIVSVSRNKQKYNGFIHSLDSNPNLDRHILPDCPRLIRSNDFKRHHLEQGISLNSFNYKKHFNEELKESVNNKYLTSKKLASDLFKKNGSIPIPPPLLSLEPKYVHIERSIENINDLLGIINDYPLKLNNTYNINLEALHNIKAPLTELNEMIGMKDLKENIVDQILFYIQDLHNGTNDFMHTCIYGPPGTGKTEIAKIIGKIFSSLGILKKKTFEKVTRSDLIAGYLGQTALKTSDAIKKALGGVLFIDEAYSLGNPEKRDSFAKECLDTLCEGLSDHKDNLMVIIAGYEKDLEKCFFSYNQGLNSRFTWRFKTDEYNSHELRDIFHKKIREIGWELESNKIPSIKWFDDKKEYFKYYGRDMETLLSKVKIVHGRRVFCLSMKDKKRLTMKDIDAGFKKFLDKEEVKNRKSDDDTSYKNMFL